MMLYKIDIYKVVKRGVIIPLLFLAMVIPVSCKKYLEKKTVQSLVVPTSLNDLLAVLEDQKLNFSTGYLELVADNYYVTNASWNGVTSIDQRKNYIWSNDARITVDQQVWSSSYEAIYQANFVLDLLPTIVTTESDQNLYRYLKGAGLFYRAFQFYQVAQLFCRPYSSSAAVNPGIVIKLTSNVNDHYSRSTVQRTYDQILIDLKTAAAFLPVTTLFATRPNKAAAYGMLARVYLSMRDYSNASLYADTALSLNNTLLDYNTLTPVGNPMLPSSYLSNPEVSFLSRGGADLLNPPNPIIDSNLYQSYNANDLRKTIFFGLYLGDNHYWKGSYYTVLQYYAIFAGVATDEIYLIRAECRARSENINGAMQDLNLLLHNRWKTGLFTGLTATNAADALNQILIERRKELLFRGLRWTDLRRLNLENANITLTRIINGVTYTLPPNDIRWVLLIPDIEINRSGIQQNVR